jgi:hypothetical protein
MNNKKAISNPREKNVVAEIKKRYGNVIDLEKSPMTIIEIIYNFRYLLDELAGPDGTGGGPPKRLDAEEVGTATVLNLLLELRREVKTLSSTLEQPMAADDVLPR